MSIKQTNKLTLTVDQHAVLDAAASTLRSAYRPIFFADAYRLLWQLRHPPSDADVSRIVEDLLGIRPTDEVIHAA